MRETYGGISMESETGHNGCIQVSPLAPTMFVCVKLWWPYWLKGPCPVPGMDEYTACSKTKVTHT